MHLSKMSKLSELHFTDIDNVMPVGFWSAIDVWIKKPHVVNKRLCGAKQDETTEVNVCELEHILSTSWCSATEELNTIFSFLNNGVDNPKTIGGRWCCVIRTLIPKVNSYGNNSYKEIVLKDVSRQCITFLPFEERGEENSVPRKSNVYQIRFKAVNTTEWSVEISTLRPDEWFSDGVVYPKLPWLSSELLPKLVRWSTESRTSEFKSTLSLIPLEKYSLLYQRLKERYKEMVKVWPEVTDPEKFVYEDVAIATYLLVLWEGERAEKGLTAKQSFVDLGCGNGLLVHILSNEGHPGKGIDVRKRKIWDTYGPQTRLEESAITPSESCLFPDADWLIGNHSDELTPWIPVISSRSSYTCQYFVLPCCFFDFNGKYQRRQCKTSQYKEYIDFVSEVGSVCGFQVDEDCLRIPSTKRVCLIGRSRSYEPSGEAQVDVLRTQYIEKRLRNCAVGGRPKSGGSPPSEHRAHGHSGADWGGGFQPREKIESVRNCASLPRDFVEGIVLQVALALLGLKSEESCDKDKWNQGGSLSVREVAELLEKGTLHTLKKECGGLQTLLKNNHQVFRVEGGCVRIRDWRAPAGERKARPGPRGTPEDYRKTQPCWFHTHHPQGCPLLAGSCAFAHGPEELRPSARLGKKRKNM